jgi:predicted ABC-type transport system involved in lysophospholipase L1 biosynthesis ATPase subunit
MFSLARERDVAFVVATHDENLARRTDRLLHIEDGVLETVGMDREWVGSAD